MPLRSTSLSAPLGLAFRQAVLRGALLLALVSLASCWEEEDGTQPAPNGDTAEDTSEGDSEDADGDGITVAGGDCDDSDATISPYSQDVPYDGIDQDCDGVDVTDVDQDGYDAIEAGGTDCDDADGEIHPDIDDPCGGVDDDCDGVEDDDADADGDGVTTCDGDCDDNDAAVSPDATDIGGNDVDEDCNGRVRGDCSDDILSGEWEVQFSVYFDDCDSDVESGYSIFRDDISVPEDADCSGTTARWSGSVNDSDNEVYTSVDITFDTQRRCGSFSGAGSHHSAYCDDVTGEINDGC